MYETNVRGIDATGATRTLHARFVPMKIDADTNGHFVATFSEVETT